MFLHFPTFVPSLPPTFIAFLGLLSGYDLDTLPLPTFDYLSLLLGADAGYAI
jgi:hypothetical protein